MPTYKLSVDSHFDEMLDSTVKSSTVAPNVKSKEQVIHNAVALYVFLHNEVEGEGSGRKVAIIDENSQIVKIIDPLP